MAAPTPLAALLSLPATEVAPRLLGAVLRHESRDGVVAVRLSEVEAYEGPATSARPDPGSHGFRGQTPRNAAMFGPPGRLYVYFTYGRHFCVNVVCGADGDAAACLLRAGEIIQGVDVARVRRPAARHDVELARGPARLAVALGLRGDHNGALLGTGALSLRLPTLPVPAAAVASGPRVGVRGAGGTVAYPWRFWCDGDPTVSRYRPAAPRAPAAPRETL